MGDENKGVPAARVPDAALESVIVDADIQKAVRRAEALVAMGGAAATPQTKLEAIAVEQTLQQGGTVDIGKLPAAVGMQVALDYVDAQAEAAVKRAVAREHLPDADAAGLTQRAEKALTAQANANVTDHAGLPGLASFVVPDLTFRRAPTAEDAMIAGQAVQEAVTALQPPAKAGGKTTQGQGR